MPHLEPGADGEHLTFCRICEALCGLVATVKDGKVVKIGPDRDHVTSEGHLCLKGPAMLGVAYDEDRVTRPLKRVGGPGEFAPVSWDEALDDIAERLAGIIDRHGGDSLGVYKGNPTAYGFRHMPWTFGFTKAFGSKKMFGPVHTDTGSKVLACSHVYGPGIPYTFPDLEHCDFLMIVGGNPMVSHMSLISEPRVLHKLTAIAARGAVVVIDPRRTETARRFEHIAVPPDSDIWLLGGMLKMVFEEGHFDASVLDRRLSGWREFSEAVRTLDMAEAAERCRLSVEEIRTLTRRYVEARTAACYGRLGTNRGTFSTLLNVFIEALNIVTGRFGQEGGWITRPSPFRTSGAPPASSPPSLRSRIGDIPLLPWFAPFQPGGSLADDILTPGEGQLRALICDSGNPVLAYPGGPKLEGALETLELHVGLDFYINETTKYAHYILPAPTFLERADLSEMAVMRASRPWLQYTDAVIPPVGESRLEVEFYNGILTRMGRPPVEPIPLGAGASNAAVVEMIDEHLGRAALGDLVGKLDVERMRSEFPHGVRLDRSRDAETVWERIGYPDKRACLWDPMIAAEFNRLAKARGEPVDRRLKLFGRRRLKSINTWLHNDARLVRTDAPTLLIHPADAEARQIREGQRVAVTSASGRIEVVVEITDEVIEGAVSYPHGWGHAGGWRTANAQPGANVNELASSDPKDWEQVSGMCLIDGIPVEVTAV